MTTNNNDRKGINPFLHAILCVIIILYSVTMITDILHVSFVDLILLAVCFSLLPKAIAYVLRFIFTGAKSPEKEPSNPENT